MPFCPLPVSQRPQDPMLDGAGWTYETLEHGGEEPDTMPQAIRATDAAGRSCVYVPLRQDGVIGTYLPDPVAIARLGG